MSEFLIAISIFLQWFKNLIFAILFQIAWYIRSSGNIQCAPHFVPISNVFIDWRFSCNVRKTLTTCLLVRNFSWRTRYTIHLVIIFIILWDNIWPTFQFRQILHSFEEKILWQNFEKISTLFQNYSLSTYFNRLKLKYVPLSPNCVFPTKQYI